MSVLSDYSIRKALESGLIEVVGPLMTDDCFQPASVDLHLGLEIQDKWGKVIYRDGDVRHIGPGEFILACTSETVSVGEALRGQIHGKSSLARRGIQIHATAGYIDPGWAGTLTLEIYNLSDFPQDLIVGQKICQVSFEELTTPAERAYGHPDLNNHYQNSKGVQQCRA